MKLLLITLQNLINAPWPTWFEYYTTDITEIELVGLAEYIVYYAGNMKTEVFHQVYIWPIQYALTQKLN